MGTVMTYKNLRRIGILTVFVIYLTGFYISNNLLKNNLNIHSNHHLGLQLDSMTYYLTDYLYDNNLMSFKRIIDKELIGKTSIKEIYVTDSKNTILVTSDTLMKNRKLKETNVISLRRFINDNTGKMSWVKIIIPVLNLTDNESEIYNLIIKVDRSFWEKAFFKKLRLPFLIFSLIILSMLLVVTYINHRLVSRPIKEFIQFANSKSDKIKKCYLKDLNKLGDYLKVTSNDLAKERNKFKEMFYKHKAMRLLIDVETGQVVDANNSACDFYGYSISQFKSMNLNSLSVLKPKQVFKIIQDGKDELQNYFRIKHKLKSGEIRKVEIYSTPIKLDNKILLFYLIHDVTKEEKYLNALEVARVKLQEQVEIEQRYNSFIQTMPGIVYECKMDSYWTMLKLNAATKEITGYDPEEFLYNKKRSFSSIIHPDDVSKVESDILNAINANNKYILDYRIITKNKEVKWVHERGKGHFDDGKVQWLSGVILDMSEKFNLAREVTVIEDKYKTLFDGAYDAIFISDIDTGNIVDCNPAACILMESNRDDLIGMNHKSLYLNNTVSHTHLDGPLVEGSLKTKNDNLVPVSIKSNKIFFNSKQYVQAILRDITEVKQREQDLSTIVNQEVERRTVQDKLLQQQSKMADIGGMVSAISHQWKQPLNVIYMSTQRIEDEILEKNIDRQKIINIQKTVGKQVEFLIQTLNDFRDFLMPAKNLDDFSVKQSIIKIFEIIRPQLELHKIKIELEGKDILAFGIDNEFKQVILNIVNNAMDNFEEKEIKKPVVKIDLSSKGDRANILISDNGGGIASDLLPEKIFEPFITTKGKDGNGIGMSLAKRLIEVSMNGDLIAFNSSKGACFQIELPISCSNPKILLGLNESISILFVEDEEVARETMVHFLTGKFAHVHVAVDGKDAMEKYELYKIDIVVTDINMPVQNGNDLVEFIRKKNMDIPVIALTGVAEDIKKPEYFSAILEKPIKKKVLFETIDKFRSKKKK